MCNFSPSKIMPSRYQYRPLDRDMNEIRLLVVEPGEPQDPIRAKVKHVYFCRDRFLYFNHSEVKYETC